jgi:UDP-N-acetylmuramoylalanine--D-glutamate ligase
VIRLVLGGGASGRAAAEAARRLGETAVMLSDDARETVEGALAPFGGRADGVVVSPGLPPSHPWLAACRALSLPVESEVAFGCRHLRREGARLVAVTGSKGKSSVVKILAEGLSRAGYRALPCGNYGLPVSDLVARGPSPRPAFHVVEVSSFMLETTALPAGTFEAAAVLNLQEDHLDRHGSVAVYHALKRRLLAMADVAYDLSSPSCRDALARAVASPPPFAGSYFDNPVLRDNALFVDALLARLGVSAASRRETFRSFRPLAHRMECVGVFGGVECIDDSKATSLAALAAGVEMTRSDRVRLIAGGLPKGDDPKKVKELLTKRVKKVYLIGRCAEDFAAAWSDAVTCVACGTLERAVARAMRDAEEGDILLLSPGTASFDQFKSFEERGEAFARLVQTEGYKEL